MKENVKNKNVPDKQAPGRLTGVLYAFGLCLFKDNIERTGDSTCRTYELAIGTPLTFLLDLNNGHHVIYNNQSPTCANSNTETAPITFVSIDFR